MMAMGYPKLKISWQRGKPSAAYLYLCEIKPGAAVRTQRCGEALIDFDRSGAVLGFELISITNESIESLREILAKHGIETDAIADLSASIGK